MIANSPDFKLLLDNCFLPNQPFAPTAATAAFIGPDRFDANTEHFVIKPDVWLNSNNGLTATWVSGRPDLFQQNGPAKNAARQYWSSRSRQRHL